MGERRRRKEVRGGRMRGGNAKRTKRKSTNGLLRISPCREHLCQGLDFERTPLVDHHVRCLVKTSNQEKGPTPYGVRITEHAVAASTEKVLLHVVTDCILGALLTREVR